MSEKMSYEVEQGVAVITLNSPPVNALGYDVRAGIVEGFERAAEDNQVKAAVLICEGRTFFAGADITEFGKPPRLPDLRGVLEVIENFPKLSVAAIHGTALGGGFETALTCNYRVAVPSAKVGLPEVALGLLPGAGGTQRLPRIVGVPMALDLMTSGRHITAKEAQDNGAIDAIANEGELRKDAMTFAQSLIEEGAKLTRVRDRTDGFENAEIDSEFFAAFRKKNARKFRGFKAPENIIKAVEAAVTLPFDDGMKRERELFEELRTSNESAAQRYNFFAERQTSKIPDISKDTPKRDIKNVGVIGAGTMGGGITMNFLNAGIPVTLVERSQDALDRGIGVIRKNYETSAKKGRMTAEQVEKAMALISPATELEALADVDLTIEAVFEQMSIKQEIFSKLDTIAKKGAILASNTSYLDLDEIAASTKRPEDVIGLHFFSPANVMPLLEIVRGEKTAPDLVATALSLAKKIRKTPVVARVCHGFIANRVMTVRGKQADAMSLEGINPETIDRVLYDYGFAMGNFRMRDMIGLDVIGRDSNVKTVTGELVARGRLGLKKNGGYYDYDENRNATLSQVALDVIKEVAEENGIEQTTMSEDDILARMLYPIVNEGAKALDEKIVVRGSDIDIACIKGYNWPVYTGGPMFWADTVGLDNVVAKLAEFEARFGSFFKPSALLVKCANEGKRLSDITIA